MKDSQMIEKAAFDSFNSGFHCAESVFKAIMESQGRDVGELIHMATAFGGGMGKSHEEACGALSGGLLALGALRGRNVAGEDWGPLAKLTAEFRKRFAEENGTTQCSAILEQFGEQDNMDKCKRMTGRAAGILAELLGS